MIRLALPLLVVSVVVWLMLVAVPKTMRGKLFLEFWRWAEIFSYVATALLCTGLLFYLIDMVTL